MRDGAIIVAAYDGTSRVPGASLGARALLDALTAAGLTAAASRQRHLRDDSKSSALWCRRLLELARGEDVALTLGGEHLVTFPVLEALRERHAGLRLVVFDAHHDAYEHPLLTHWSVLRFAAVELQVPTLVVGVRHEVELCAPGVTLLPMAEVSALGPRGVAARIEAFTAGAPFYLSVDLDVLEPERFPAVSDRVAGGLSIEALQVLVRGALHLGPVAMDLVELNPLREREVSPGLPLLRPLLEEVAAWVS